MNKKWFTRFLATLWVVVILFTAGASPGKGPAQVALLPLQINAPDRLDYLRDGLLDIMASRLAWEGKVVVLDQDPVQKALKKIPGTMDEARAQEIGKGLGVDYVVFGSLTQIGAGASIDIRVSDLAKNQPADKFYAETKGLDDIIPQLNQVLEELNEKTFQRPRTAAVVSTGPRPAGTGPALPGPGEKPGLALKDFTLRPLSPQIIVNAGGFDLTGIWRSSILPYALRDLAFGDLDGDGNLETVIISQKAVHIYRFKDDKFNLLTEITGHRNDNYIGVDVADINGTGRPQIFVSNFRNDGIRSLVLAWEGDGYKTIAKEVPYCWRVQQLPGRGRVLVGQERRGDYAFGTKIKVLAWREGRYVAVEELNLPDEVNVFNFIISDLDGDDSPETIYLDRTNHLVVLSAQGKVEYRSNDFYGGTISYVDASEPGAGVNLLGTSTISEREARTYLPARLVVTPGTTSRKVELILNKNKDSIWNVLDRFASFSNGVIYSLSWDGAAFRENWRTMTINDYIANYSVEDFKNIKQKQLVVGVVQSQGLPIIGKARSLIYCYDLGAVKFEKR